MRHLVKLQSYAVTTNSHGEEDKTYADIDEVWADIQPLRGKELFAAQQVQAEVDLKVFVRYPETTLAAKDRVLFGTRTFDILAVINSSERNRHLELLCKERP